MFIYRKSQLDLFNKHRAGWEKQQQAGQTRHRAAHESKQRKPEKRPAGDVVEHKKKKKRKSRSCEIVLLEIGKRQVLWVFNIFF